MDNNGLKRCFQDQPLDQRALLKMEMDIMKFVMAHPIDFKQQLILHKRRQWGLIVLGVMVAIGIFASVLMEYWGMAILEVWRQIVITISPYLPFSGVFDRWLSYLTDPDWAVAILGYLKHQWQNYSPLVVVVLTLWVVQGDLSDKATPLK